MGGGCGPTGRDIAQVAKIRIDLPQALNSSWGRLKAMGQMHDLFAIL